MKYGQLKVSINMDKTDEQSTIEARKKSDKRRREISELVLNRMQHLGMTDTHYGWSLSNIE